MPRRVPHDERREGDYGPNDFHVIYLQNVSIGLHGTPPPPPLNIGVLPWSRLSAAPAPIGGAEASGRE
jgi:hypothetical protein